MLPVQPRRRRQRDKELAAVSVGPGIRHAQHAGARMPQPLVDLVLELFAVDGAAAAACARRVARLYHKVGNHAVHGTLVVIAARGQRGEVAARLGRVLGVELQRNGTLMVIRVSGAIAGAR